MSNYNTFSVLDSDDDDFQTVTHSRGSKDKKKSKKTKKPSSSSSSANLNPPQQLSTEATAPARRSDRSTAGGNNSRRRDNTGSRRQDTGNGRDSRGKRVRDRQSGTGRSSGVAKNGGGRANWGTMEDELKMVEGGEQQGPNNHTPSQEEGETENKQSEVVVVEEVEEDPNMTVEQYRASKARVATRNARQVDASQLAGLSRVTNKKDVSEESKSSTSTTVRLGKRDDGSEKAYAMFGFSKHHTSGFDNNHRRERRNDGSSSSRGGNRRVNTQDKREFPSLRA